MPTEWKRGDYTIRCDPERLDLGVVHGFLTTSYWAVGVSEDVVRRSIEHSLCFGVYDQESQVGFARVITDAPPLHTSPTSSSSRIIEGMAWACGSSRQSWRIRS